LNFNFAKTWRDMMKIADAQSRIPDIDYRNNVAQRTPCVLVVDGSTSMEGEPIDLLNDGLQRFEEALKADDSASTQVQVLVIRMGGHDDAEVVQPWCDASQFAAPYVEANGTTPMGHAMALALLAVEQQKDALRSHGIPYTRPWIFLLSDGQPSDSEWEKVAQVSRQAEQERKAIIWPVGVGRHADLPALSSFSSGRPAVQVEAAQFEDMFQWLSASLAAVSASQAGEQVALPSATWASVEA
jgi:uncharacterized protein YegL